MVRVSHNFGLSAEYIFALFHAVCLLCNPHRGAGTSDFILPDLNSWLGYTVLPTQNPFELGLIGLKRIILWSTVNSMPGIYRIQ